VKELFVQYRQDRTQFTRAVHNTSAALADAIFRHKLQQPTNRAQGKDRVLLVTGVPGAGKTTTFGKDPTTFDSSACLSFESNISDPEIAFPRIDAILNANYKPVVVVLYADPTTCLARVVRRAKQIGRVVDIDYIASLHKLINVVIRKIRAKYGGRVPIKILDNSVDGRKPINYDNIDILDVVEYKGSLQELKEMLRRQLDELRTQQYILEELYNEIGGTRHP
jgi:hypothetical protein